jgi:hypothetical protein
MATGYELKIRLDRYAGMYRADPYWLSNDDCGFTYCRKCALQALRAKPGAELDGGFHCENDSCQHCETCGRLLDYTLTNYGAAEEINHFSKIRFRKPLDRDQAYHIARMLGANTEDEAAIKIAHRAVAKIPKGAGPNRRVYR